ncbi:hypothetical protein [Propionivibrio dicarboxylicus]|uniref:hypothetical protein n=1 Tax=Propionivibrio dicarboxylicus TaxID=83767 RepID=UPI00115FB228|nr:hypothetical protein [Propionivibrio dicarboxylicus]
MAAWKTQETFHSHILWFTWRVPLSVGAPAPMIRSSRLLAHEASDRDSPARPLPNAFRNSSRRPGIPSSNGECLALVDPDHGNEIMTPPI